MNFYNSIIECRGKLLRTLHELKIIIKQRPSHMFILKNVISPLPVYGIKRFLYFSPASFQVEINFCNWPVKEYMLGFNGCRREIGVVLILINEFYNENVSRCLNYSLMMGQIVSYKLDGFIMCFSFQNVLIICANNLRKGSKGERNILCNFHPIQNQ